ADREAMLGLERAGLVKVEPACLLLEEGVRQLAGDAGAVARLPADAAAVFHVFQREEGFLDDLVARFARASAAAADAAGIATHLVAVEQIPFTDKDSSVQHLRENLSWRRVKRRRTKQTTIAI